MPLSTKSFTKNKNGVTYPFYVDVDLHDRHPLRSRRRTSRQRVSNLLDNILDRWVVADANIQEREALSDTRILASETAGDHSYR